MQEEIATRRTDIAALMSLSQTMSSTASPEDSLTLSDRMAQIKAAFEALERNAAARKRALEDGLEQVRVKGYNIYILYMCSVSGLHILMESTSNLVMNQASSLLSITT